MQKTLLNSLKKENATDFQIKVYNVVLGIPKGQVRSYSDVAKSIGNPRAARAVGNALKKNPFPVRIPCHRVISASGAIGRYSAGGGKKRKKQLLKKEGYSSG